MTISPSLFDRGKDRMLAGLSLLLYIRFRRFDSAALTKARERSYCRPSTAFFKAKKGKLGSLPFLYFFIEMLPFGDICLLSAPFSFDRAIREFAELLQSFYFPAPFYAHKGGCFSGEF